MHTQPPDGAEDELGPLGVLVLTLHSAEGLRAADRSGTSDPYVIASLVGRPDCRWSSRTKWGTLNPKWEQTHEWPGLLNDLIQQQLKLRVYDRDLASFDDPLGEVIVPLTELQDAIIAHKELHPELADPLAAAIGMHLGGALQGQVIYEKVPLTDPSSSAPGGPCSLDPPRTPRRKSLLSSLVTKVSQVNARMFAQKTPTTGTITFSVAFKLKYSIGMFPGAPVHASAPQALRRPPPATAWRRELMRDRTLLFLGHKFFLYVAVVWALCALGWILFIGVCFLGLYFLPDGALGQLSKDRCKFWSNICIQVMTGLFSYLNGITAPWRLAIGFHIAGYGHGPWKNGTDFYGRRTDAIWFHIPYRPRKWITILMLSSTFCHFGSQACRAVWSSYYEANETIATLPVNATFIGSVLCAIAAGITQGVQEGKLVAADKAAGTHRFPPTIGDILKEQFRRWRSGEIGSRRQALTATKAAHTNAFNRWFAANQADALQRACTRQPERVAESSGRSRRMTDAFMNTLRGAFGCRTSSRLSACSVACDSTRQDEIDVEEAPPPPRLPVLEEAPPEAEASQSPRLATLGELSTTQSEGASSPRLPPGPTRQASSISTDSGMGVTMSGKL